MTKVLELGRVAGVFRYPVKSMRGESLGSGDVGWTGFAGDRQYAFFKTANKSRFPWLTGRDVPELVLGRAAYDGPETPRTSAVRVTMPDGMVYDIAAPALRARLCEAAGDDVAVLQVGRGTFDSMPISVVGHGTLDAIGLAFGQPVHPGRFRPNIVVDRGRESDWIGESLIFGDPAVGPRLRVCKPIERCSMITLDPETAQRAPALLRTVVEEFNNEVGVYCTPERLGAIAVGDRVWMAQDQR